MLHWQCLQIRAIRTSYSRCGLLQSGPNLARLVWFIAAIVATASQFPANETKFFGVWHKSSFQLARATAAAAAELVQFILARSLLFGCSVSQAGRQSVDCIKWIYCQLLNYALCSRTIYYLHFYCYFCNLLALPTRRRLDSLPVPCSLFRSRGPALLPSCPAPYLSVTFTAIRFQFIFT